MLTVVAFVVALGLLIAVHEYGHYRVAVACGVKVLRFSVGFGKPLYSWQPHKQPGRTPSLCSARSRWAATSRCWTSAKAPVAPASATWPSTPSPCGRAPRSWRPGPLANLLLAIVLYAIVNWSGVQEPKPVLASPVAGSIAERAGLRGGERVQQAGFDGEALQAVRSFEELRWLLTRGALDGRDVRLALAEPMRAAARSWCCRWASSRRAMPMPSCFARSASSGPGPGR